MDEAASARLHEVLGSYVDRGLVPGLVAAVARGAEDDEVHVAALGSLSFDDGALPMRADSLFRITSMTKPVVAVAALSLVHEGGLDLDEPVDRLLPELASPRVLVRPDGPLEETVPAERPVTVEDVLTFRLGWGTPAADFPSWPLFVAAERLGLCIGPPLPRPSIGQDEWLARLGSLPLLHQPGEAWRYDVGASVLGVLVARAAGRSLPEVLDERVLEPLGMADTGWHVPPEDLDRLTTSYGPDEAGGLQVFDPGGGASAWATPPTFPDGASGLVCTIGDYVTFGRFLLGDGASRSGRRVLSPELIERTTTDRLTPAQRSDPMAEPFLAGGGWGYGVGVDPEGRHGWVGGFGTAWRNVPPAAGEPGRVEVVLSQRAVYPEPIDLFPDFWAVADLSAV
jgi:CubicO group peptidase (beta-lactamase class C family)